MKYAVDRSLAGAKYEDEDIGASLQRVLQYWTMKKFNGVDKALENIGIKRVEVTEEGLKFIR